MMDKTYSTAQVDGMTSIPTRTMQGYVKDFRDCFSETARQPSKGRRFTDADIKTLLTIKRARSQRITDDDIRKIISGEINYPLAQEYKDDDIKQMAVSASENLKRAMLINDYSEEMIAHAKASMTTMQNEIQKMQEEFNVLKSRVDKFKEWQIFVMKTDSLFNPYTDKEPAQDAKPTDKKRVGFMNWLDGG